MARFAGISELAGENRVLELFWTVLPTVVIMGSCYFNLHFLSPLAWGPEGRVLKIIGSQ